MNIIFDDNNLHLAFAPLTLTRPVADLRIGINTISESWLNLISKKKLVTSVEYKTEKYLTTKFKPVSQEGLIIAGNIKPTKALADLVTDLEKGEALYVNDKWVAQNGMTINKRIEGHLAEDNFLYLTKPWHLFQFNGKSIVEDYGQITAGRTTMQPDSTNTLIGDGEVFIEEGAKVHCTILNSKNGPIYCN